MRLELALFSSHGPPLELTGACLLTRSVEQDSSSTVKWLHPGTLEIPLEVVAPEYRNMKGRALQPGRKISPQPLRKDLSTCV